MPNCTIMNLPLKIAETDRFLNECKSENKKSETVNNSHVKINKRELVILLTKWADDLTKSGSSKSDGGNRVGAVEDFSAAHQTILIIKMIESMNG